NSIAARMAIMAMTTSNSMRVKPLTREKWRRAVGGASVGISRSTGLIGQHIMQLLYTMGGFVKPQPPLKDSLDLPGNRRILSESFQGCLFRGDASILEKIAMTSPS